MSNSFKLYPTHFSRGREKFFRGGQAPLVTGLSHITVDWTRWRHENNCSEGPRA